MKIVKGTQIFFGILGLIIVIIAITIIGYDDRSVVIAVSPGSITTMDTKTGEIETERNWWNNSIKVNDTINFFQMVVGCGDSIPQLHLDITEDSMIAQTTRPQG